MTQHWFYPEVEPFKKQVNALEFTWKEIAKGYRLKQGLGKSKITCSDFYRHYLLGVVDTMIVTCPNSLKSNWRAEWNALTQKDTNIQVYIWPEDRKKLEGVIGNCVIVVNYESLLTEAGRGMLDRFLTKAKVFWTLDESSRIKNPQAKTTKIIINAPKAQKPRSELAVMRRVLTGTMISQSAMDAYSQLKFLNPKMPFNPFSWKLRYCQTGGYLGKQIVGVRNSAELKRLLDEWTFYAEKGSDMPPKIFENKTFELQGNHLAIYKKMKKDFLLAMEDTEVTASIALTQLGKLMQISRGFVVDDNGESQELVPWDENPAVQLIYELIEETEDKVVVVGRHKYFVRKMIEELSKKYTVAHLIGGMKPDAIDEQKKLFNEGDAKIMVLQIDSGKFGHSFVGDGHNCHTMIFGELTFSLEAYEQVTDRINRLTQKETCVYYTIQGTPVDCKISEALQKKQKIVDTIEGIKSLVSD